MVPAPRCGIPLAQVGELAFVAVSVLAFAPVGRLAPAVFHLLAMVGLMLSARPASTRPASARPSTSLPASARPATSLPAGTWPERAGAEWRP